MSSPASTTVTHQWWSSRGPEPCPRCRATGQDEVVSCVNVMYGQINEKRCKACHFQWTLKIAEDPD